MVRAIRRPSPLIAISSERTAPVTWRVKAGWLAATVLAIVSEQLRRSD